MHFGRDAALENCIFYLSSLYEFSHNLDPSRTYFEYSEADGSAHLTEPCITAASIIGVPAIL